MREVARILAIYLDRVTKWVHKKAADPPCITIYEPPDIHLCDFCKPKEYHLKFTRKRGYRCPHCDARFFFVRVPPITQTLPATLAYKERETEPLKTRLLTRLAHDEKDNIMLPKVPRGRLVHADTGLEVNTKELKAVKLDKRRTG